MSECLLWKSETRFFRSAICGLSTAAMVIVFELLPPPPPPAPEHAAPARATINPMAVVATSRHRGSGEPSFLSVMESHPFFARGLPRQGACDISQRCHKDNVDIDNTKLLRL